MPTEEKDSMIEDSPPAKCSITAVVLSLFSILVFANGLYVNHGWAGMGVAMLSALAVLILGPITLIVLIAGFIRKEKNAFWLAIPSLVIWSWIVSKWVTGP